MIYKVHKSTAKVHPINLGDSCSVGGQRQAPVILTPWKRPTTHRTGGCVAPPPGPVCTGGKILARTRIRSQDHPARSKSLYRLSYTGPRLYSTCTTCKGADKSLARPGRKQANVSVRMASISFGALPCKKKNLITARVSMLLKSRESLTCFRACFLPGRAKDLSASL